MASGAHRKTSFKMTRLPDAVHSPSQLRSFLDELVRLRDWQRQNRIRHQAGLRPLPQPDISEALADLVPETANPKVADGVIKQAEAKVATILKQNPVVTITMAGLPDERTKRQITGWFRRQIGNQVLCRYTADRGIAGGAVVRTPNRIFDYSWRRRLLDNRDAVARVVRHVR